MQLATDLGKRAKQILQERNPSCCGGSSKVEADLVASVETESGPSFAALRSRPASRFAVAQGHDIWRIGWRQDFTVDRAVRY